MSVANLVMLHGEPAWLDTLEYIRVNRKEILKVQRHAALHRMCVYCTVSYDAVYILASISPIELLTKGQREDQALSETPAEHRGT